MALTLHDRIKTSSKAAMVNPDSYKMRSVAAEKKFQPLLLQQRTTNSSFVVLERKKSTIKRGWQIGEAMRWKRPRCLKIEIRILDIQEQLWSCKCKPTCHRMWGGLCCWNVCVCVSGEWVSVRERERDSRCVRKWKRERMGECEWERKRERMVTLV